MIMKKLLNPLISTGHSLSADLISFYSIK